MVSILPGRRMCVWWMVSLLGACKLQSYDGTYSGDGSIGSPSGPSNPGNSGLVNPGQETTLSSADGDFILHLPAGAISSPTNLSIQRQGTYNSSGLDAAVYSVSPPLSLVHPASVMIRIKNANVPTQEIQLVYSASGSGDFQPLSVGGGGGQEGFYYGLTSELGSFSFIHAIGSTVAAGGGTCLQNCCSGTLYSSSTSCQCNSPQAVNATNLQLVTCLESSCVNLPTGPCGSNAPSATPLQCVGKNGLPLTCNAGQSCCLAGATLSTVSGSCTASGGCSGLEFKCFSSSHCAAGSMCCSSASGSYCAAKCTGAAQLCQGGQECGNCRTSSPQCVLTTCGGLKPEFCP